MAHFDKDIEPSPTASSSQLDDTYAAYKANRGVEIDPSELKKTLRKIDRRIVPILFFIYLLQYLDKNGINYASAFGFIEATHLGKNGYSWLGTYLDTPPSCLGIFDKDAC
jgi:hypothetical protein